MKTITISGREYLMVQATRKSSNCYGCALDAEKTGKSCAFVVEQLLREDRCRGNLVYILNTPESIAAYAAERLS